MKQWRNEERGLEDLPRFQSRRRRRPLFDVCTYVDRVGCTDPGIMNESCCW